MERSNSASELDENGPIHDCSALDTFGRRSVILVIGCLLVSAVFFAAARHADLSAASFRSRGSVATATVVGHVPAWSAFVQDALVVRFTTADGRVVEAATRVNDRSSYPVGSRVAVIYAPEEPRDALTQQPQRPLTRQLLGINFALAGAAVGAFGWWWISRIRAARASTTRRTVNVRSSERRRLRTEVWVAFAPEQGAPPLGYRLLPGQAAPPSGTYSLHGPAVAGKVAVLVADNGAALWPATRLRAP